VGPTDKIYDWLSSHPDGERWDGMLAWIQAVALDPGAVSSGTYMKGRRQVHYAHVPKARTRVSFILFDTPVFALHIVEIDDDKYQGG